MARFSFDDYHIESLIPRRSAILNPFLVNSFESDENLDDDSEQIFNLEQTNLRFPNSCIVSFQIANNVAIVLTENGKVLVYNLEGRSNFINCESIDINRVGLSIGDVYLDRAGKYFIACYTTKLEAHLYRIQPSKSRALTKLSNVPISCIYWNNQDNSCSFSQVVLIGSKNGEIYECDLDNPGRRATSLPDGNIHLVLNLKRDGSSVGDYHITGIAVRQTPVRNNVGVLISTLSQLLYIGGILSSNSPKFNSLFSLFTDSNIFYDTPNDHSVGSLVVFPANDLSFSKIAYVSGKRVAFGKLNDDTDPKKIPFSDFKILSFSESMEEFPISVVLSEFHCVALYHSRFVSVNLIDEGVTVNDLVGAYLGTPKGLFQDNDLSRIWYYTSKNVMFYSINNEVRNVWKLYLDKNMFEEAFKYSMGNEKIITTIIQKKADFLYNSGDFLSAAELYSKSDVNFEEVVLKFSNQEQVDSLILYLESFLNKLNIDKHITQVCMLSLWITNLLLSKYEELTDETDKNNMKTKLRLFLKSKNAKIVLQKYRLAFYNLFDEYGNESMLIFAAKLLNDTDKLINYFLCCGKYSEILELLISSGNEYFIYQCFPILFRFIPKCIIDVLSKPKNDFDQRRLILPIIKSDLINGGGDHIVQFLRYRQYCFETLQIKRQVIHDQYIALLVHLGNENTFLSYLEKSIDNIYYNKQYALRLASKHNMNKSSIKILCSMNLYEEALELALKVDLDLARECARKPEDTDRKRKLWLSLAKTTITSNTGVEEVMKFISDSGVLKIDDVLGLISDFKNIDSFRDAICESLQHYNKVVDNLTTEIHKLSSISERLRYDNYQLSHRASFISQESQCAICGLLLLVRPFYSYPCTHNFHQSCFLKKYFSITSKKNKKIIFDQLLQITDGISDHFDQRFHREKSGTPEERMSYLVDLLETVLTSSYEFPSSRFDLKNSIDQKMVYECIICGEYSIRLITQKLVPGVGIYD